MRVALGECDGNETQIGGARDEAGDYGARRRQAHRRDAVGGS